MGSVSFSQRKRGSCSVDDQDRPAISRVRARLRGEGKRGVGLEWHLLFLRKQSSRGQTEFCSGFDGVNQTKKKLRIRKLLEQLATGNRHLIESCVPSRVKPESCGFRRRELQEGGGPWARVL